MIMLDLQKAFNIVDHENLCSTFYYGYRSIVHGLSHTELEDLKV